MNREQRRRASKQDRKNGLKRSAQLSYQKQVWQRAYHEMNIIWYAAILEAHNYGITGERLEHFYADITKHLLGLDSAEQLRRKCWEVTGIAPAELVEEQYERELEQGVLLDEKIMGVD